MSTRREKGEGAGDALVVEMDTGKEGAVWTGDGENEGGLGGRNVERHPASS